MPSGVSQGGASVAALSAVAAAKSTDAKFGIWVITGFRTDAIFLFRPIISRTAAKVEAQPSHERARLARRGSDPQPMLCLAQRRDDVAADMDEVLQTGRLERGLELSRAARKIDV